MSSVSTLCSPLRLPEHATEVDTGTLLLTGPSGAFLDIRFIKDTNQLLWGFAGYRSTLSDNVVQYHHHFDTRETGNPLAIEDTRTIKPITPFLTEELGHLTHPTTHQRSTYEQSWCSFELENPSEHAIIIGNAAGTAWYAVVDNWAQALGRTAAGTVWAWQATGFTRKQIHGVAGPGESVWRVLYSTEDRETVRFLPEEAGGWKRGTTVEWDDDVWLVLDGKEELQAE